MIEKRDGKYVLYAKSSGKKLGAHGSKKKAEAQEVAINISKAKAAGHKIPKKK